MILGGDRAAHTALAGILEVTNFAPPAADGPDGPRTRAFVADEIRACWAKGRATPPVERRYRTPADDADGARAWLGAAGNIIRPEDVRAAPAAARPPRRRRPPPPSTPAGPRCGATTP